MNVQRTIVLGVSCGAIAVWVAGAATSNPRPVVVPAMATLGQVEASGAALASEVLRLHERLRPTEVPVESRDLFRYVSRAATTLTARAPSPPSEPLAASAVPIPLLTLVGIAEDAGDDGIVRTAIVSGFGALFLVKEGEAVTPRYRVSSVLPDVVELVDTTDQTTRRLAIR